LNPSHVIELPKSLLQLSDTSISKISWRLGDAKRIACIPWHDYCFIQIRKQRRIRRRENILKWLEIIELRSSEGDRQLQKTQVQELMDDVKMKDSKETVKVYCRVIVDIDINILLFHESVNVETNGSSLGLYLTSTLKSFGIVNHSVWIEKHSLK
jgi:hypothetical protein